MGVTLTDVLLFGKAQSDDVDNATFVIYRRNILRWSALGGYLDVIVKGVSPLSLPDAIADSLSYVKAFGGTEQSGTPTPDAPMDIVSNNGVLKASRNLLDKSEFAKHFHWYIATSRNAIVYSEDSNMSISDWIKVTPGQAYTFSTQSDRTGSALFLTDEYGKTSGLVVPNIVPTTAGGTNTYTIPAGYNYIVMQTNPTYFDVDVQIEKGSTATPYTPYSPTGIYTDGTVETINVHGTNIFNKNDTENIGGWYSSSLKIATAYLNQTLVMRAKPGATYYYKHCSVSGGGRAFYTEVEDWATGSDCSVMMGAILIDKDEVKSITVSENAKWVFFNYGRTEQTATFEEQLADFMVSLTPLTSDTQYVPYYDGGTATAEMLLKVGDYQDVQSIIDGVVTRNVGVKVFDGTEEWVYYSSITGLFYSENAIVDNKLGVSALDLISNQYTATTSATLDDNYSMRFQLRATTDPTVSSHRLYIRNTNYTTVADFKQYLADQYAAGTPVIVIYPLATPTTESVAGQTLQVTDGDNTLEITQASLNGLELEAEYRAAVSLTIQEVQDANLDPNVQVTIN